MFALGDWVPVLAKEIHGEDWSPNLELVTHLQAQTEARRLGIQWAKEMPAADVERIIDATLNRYGK
jgi:hypothetical protein